MHPIVMFLGDNNAQCISRCVGVHDERLGPVGGFQDRFAHADTFEVLEGIFAFCRPVPLAVFAREVIQWPCDIGEIRDKGVVEVTEAEEAVYILDA